MSGNQYFNKAEINKLRENYMTYKEAAIHLNVNNIEIIRMQKENILSKVVRQDRLLHFVYRKELLSLAGASI